MLEGASLADSLADLADEFKASQLRKVACREALIARVQEMGARASKDGIEPAKIPEHVSNAIKEEIDQMNDWAKDQAGRFWRSLSEKPSWSELRRGNKQWHDMVISRDAQNGSSWESTGVDWIDPKSGLSAIELCSSAALQAEGSAMRHCVGSYGDTCLQGQSRIFSIRSGGARLATLQLSVPAACKGAPGRLVAGEGVWSVAQLKGVCNSNPTPEASAASKAISISIQKAMEERLAAIAGLEQKQESPEITKARSELEVPNFDAAEALRARREGLEPAAKASKKTKKMAKQ